MASGGVSRRLRHQGTTQLRRAGEAGGRRARAALALVFALAPRYARSRAVHRMRGSVEWRVCHRDGAASLYTMTFADGRCRTSRAVVAEPDLTLTLGVPDFFALALGGADPLSLVFSGRLRVLGDLELAFRLGRCFRRSTRPGP